MRLCAKWLYEYNHLIIFYNLFFSGKITEVFTKENFFCKEFKRMKTLVEANIRNRIEAFHYYFAIHLIGTIDFLFCKEGALIRNKIQ